jgi:hypothetical protein
MSWALWINVALVIAVISMVLVLRRIAAADQAA